MHRGANIRKKLAWRGRRARKYIYQRMHPAAGAAIPVFVVGCQRSGTNMLISVLDESNETWIYGEAERSPVFSEGRIRSNTELKKLLRQAKSRFVIFKPLADSQWTDRLLDIDPSAKAIWLYRNYLDVAASAVTKWGGHQRHVVSRIAQGQLKAVGWRAERIAPETMDVIRRLYSPTMSDLAGAALKWYMRNQIYFDLGLGHRAGVSLAKYEDLALKAEQTFPVLFDSLGAKFERRHIRQVFPSSVGRSRKVSLPTEIEEICDGLTARLDSEYASRALLPT